MSTVPPPDWWNLPMTIDPPEMEATWRTWLARITSGLGVPARIFHGEESGDLRSGYTERLLHSNAKFRTLQEDFTKTIVRPLLEKQFPDWFWKPIFLCSPRGRLMVRREEPEIPKITWEAADQFLPTSSQ